ncbi:MAG: hypothetical protein ACOYWZ_08780 [Bacillota bacterium]
MPNAKERLEIAVNEIQKAIGKINRKLCDKPSELKKEVIKQIIRLLKVWQAYDNRKHWNKKKERWTKRFLEELILALLKRLS